MVRLFFSFSAAWMYPGSSPGVEAKARERNKIMKIAVCKSDLKHQYGNGHPFLYCQVCHSHYSASASDVFLMNDDDVLECCDKPLALIEEVASYRSVKLKDNKMRFGDLHSGAFFGANIPCYSTCIFVKCSAKSAVCISNGETKGHFRDVHPDQIIRETYSATLVDEQAPSEKNTYRVKTCSESLEGKVFE